MVWRSSYSQSFHHQCRWKYTFQCCSYHDYQSWNVWGGGLQRKMWKTFIVCWTAFIVCWTALNVCWGWSEKKTVASGYKAILGCARTTWSVYTYTCTSWTCWIEFPCDWTIDVAPLFITMPRSPTRWEFRVYTMCTQLYMSTNEKLIECNYATIQTGNCINCNSPLFSLSNTHVTKDVCSFLGHL